MALIQITNLPQFEAQFTSTIQNISNNVFKALASDAIKLFDGLPNKVEESVEFQELKQSDVLRGKLGMASPGYTVGGDTDAPNLLEILKQKKLLITRGSGNRKFRVIFPDLKDFETNLIHNLSTISKDGGIKPGRVQSWFTWWEEGDQGAINTLTVTADRIQTLIQKSTGGRATSKTRLLDIIQQTSRSGFAIQFPQYPANEQSSIEGRHLIRRTYENYLRIFPSRMAQTLRRLVREIGGDARKLGARGVIR